MRTDLDKRSLLASEAQSQWLADEARILGVSVEEFRTLIQVRYCSLNSEYRPQRQSEQAEVDSAMAVRSTVRSLVPRARPAMHRGKGTLHAG